MNAQEVIKTIKKDFKAMTGKTAILKYEKGNIKLVLTELWLSNVKDYKSILKILHKVVTEVSGTESLITEDLLVNLPGDVEQDPETCWYHGYLSRVCEENNDKLSLLMEFELNRDIRIDDEEEEDED